MPFIYPKLNRFKKYTGKGIQVVGDGISVDGEGLASIQQVGDNKYVYTGLSTSTLQSSFEYQVKVKNNQDKFCQVLTTNLPGYPEVELWFSPTVILFTGYYNQYGGTSFSFSISHETELEEWYYITVKFDKDISIYTLDLRDSDYNLLNTKSLVPTRTIVDRGSSIIMGYSVDGTSLSYSSSYFIDLSETFIKNGEGEIISPWNL